MVKSPSRIIFLLLYEICNTSINLDNFAAATDSMLEMEQPLCKSIPRVQCTS